MISSILSVSYAYDRINDSYIIFNPKKILREDCRFNTTNEKIIEIPFDPPINSRIYLLYAIFYKFKSNDKTYFLFPNDVDYSKSCISILGLYRNKEEAKFIKNHLKGYFSFSEQSILEYPEYTHHRDMFKGFIIKELKVEEDENY